MLFNDAVASYKLLKEKIMNRKKKCKQWIMHFAGLGKE
jgi:hypothetical protein